MKNNFIVIAFLLMVSSTHAQEIKDAMRYAVDNLNGTARYRAMGGAFGALGGDLSAINVNPAGSAVFSNNQVGTTVSNYSTKNKSNYFGTNTSESENTFDLNQAGGVFVFKSHSKNANWTKIAFAVNFENTNNFDNTQFSAGVNPKNTIANYFSSYANGIPLNILENGNYSELNNAQQQAFLGYQAYLINPVSNTATNTAYTSNVREGGNYYQENGVYTNGYSGKLSFNFSTAYKDKLFIGINLNSHFTDFTQSQRFYEENNNTLTNEDRINRMRFGNDLLTTGTGFSFQLGAIAKVTDGLRLGLAYESSTWLNLSDEYSQRVSAVRSNLSGELPADVVDPRITNFYEPYKVQTPSKFTGSLAYVFGKKGLISMDYSFKNYSTTKFKPANDSYFGDLNRSMNSLLTNSGELRIGAEYKINALSLRAGYRMEESPYKDKTTIGDLTGYSAGLGYNFGSTRVDVAYSYATRNYQQGMFTTGLTDAASIDVINNNISLTLLFEL